MNFLTDNKRLLTDIETEAKYLEQLSQERKDTKEMLMHDQVGVLKGQSPRECTKNWTSQRYTKEAQSRLIAHLMSELKKHKKQELKTIDHEQKVLSNLTLDNWNK